MAESLRDQLAANYDQIVGEQSPQVSGEQAPQGADTPAEPKAEPHAEPVSPEVEKLGRTAGRARDDKGRLLPGPADHAAKAPQVAPAPEAKPRPQRPSSWKKDYWDHWEKLDPSVAEYILQRENEYAGGVSTYKKEWEQAKKEWERAKPFLDAYAPYQADFERYGIDPAKQFAKYAEIHRTFAQGNPQQKLQAFVQLVQDYKVPVHELFAQGQDGRLYFNQQFRPQPQQAQQPDVRKLVQEALNEQTMQQEIEAMKADTKTYPHFEMVREEMAGLLHAGLAQDLKSAYSKALRMHDDLFAAEQEAKRKADEAERQEAQRKAVEAARRNNVSPKSATPAGQAKGPAKGLRAQIESAYDEVMGGRV